MTQEEKAKRYDEVLKMAREQHQYPLVRESKDVLEEIFPELRESEDERIRKWLMEMVEELRKANPTNADHNGMCSEALFWLDKQGEQKDFVSKVDTLCNVYHTDSSPILFEFEDDWKVVVNAEDVKDNPADKIEPKFKIGDWVVSPNGVYWHIDKISNNRYEVTSNTGESSNWNLDTNIYHKFTIQDAKDGDVLASKNGSSILIFKNLDTSTSFSSYYNIQGKGELGWSNKCFIPATKEQRGLLFKTMEDAGYTFDFEKKELKKIEQNPAWSEEDERIINSIIHDIRTSQHYDTHSIGEYDKKVFWLKSIKEKFVDFDKGFNQTL